MLFSSTTYIIWVWGKVNKTIYSLLAISCLITIDNEVLNTNHSEGLCNQKRFVKYRSCMYLPTLASLASDVTQHYSKPRLSVFYTEFRVFYNLLYPKRLSLMKIFVMGTFVGTALAV